MSKKRKHGELASQEPRVVAQRPRAQVVEKDTEVSLREKFDALERAIADVLASSAGERQWRDALGGDRDKVDFITTLRTLNEAGDLKCLDLTPRRTSSSTTVTAASSSGSAQSSSSSGKPWPPPLPPIHTPDLLTQVFTHSTYVDLSNPHSTSLDDASKHYQRLEFLGDAVLHFVLTKLLYRRFPTSRENYLSQVRTSLENNKTLYTFARQYNLHKRVRLGKDAVISGADNNVKFAADVLEAYIGALVLDTPGGLDVAERFVTELVEPNLTKEASQVGDTFAVDRTAKQRLGLIVGGVKGVTLRYEWTAGKGGNKDGFWFTAFLTGYGYVDLALGKGWGNNKGEATQRAALNALENEKLMEELKRKKDEHLTSLGIEKKHRDKEESEDKKNGT